MAHPAIAYLSQGQYETGAQWCEQAIAVEPEALIHYWYLGLCRLLAGDGDEAQAVWWTAIASLDPEAIASELQTLMQILWTAGATQLAQGQAQAAELIYRQALELDADQPWSYLQLGHAVCLQGQLDEAIACWQRATELQPELAEAYREQAAIWHRLAQWEPAIAAYQQAIAIDPTPELRYQLALCLAQATQWGAALEQLQQVLAAQPEWGAAYGDRGWLHLELNQWTQATQDFRAALQGQADVAETYRNWVAQLQAAGCPVPDRLRQNAADLQDLCTAATSVWQRWVTPVVPQPVNAASSDAIAPPTSYHLETRTWAQAESAAPYFPLDAASEITLNPPKTCDRALHFSFRLAPQIPLPETFVVTVPQGRCWLSADQAASGIITAANELLGDLSPEFPLLTPGHPDKHPAHHSIWGRSLPPIQPIEGRVAAITGLTSDMYFHWMFDVLPRFELLRRSGIDFESIDSFWIGAQSPFQQETLQRLGIPTSKLLDPAQLPHLQAQQLIVPSYPGSPAWMPKWVFVWLQQLILGTDQPLSKPSDRLYITRQQASNRRMINEAEIVIGLEAIGFQVVALETLTVVEQARLLSTASVVISAHGGGLTNLAFCQPGTKVIEIFSPDFVYPCYWVVSNLLQLDYYYVTGTRPTGYFLQQQLYPNPRTADIWLSWAQLQPTLQLANVI